MPNEVSFDSNRNKLQCQMKKASSHDEAFFIYGRGLFLVFLVHFECE